MKQIDDFLTQSKKEIQLFVEMKPVTMKRLFGGEKDLITCTCKGSSDVNWRSMDVIVAHKVLAQISQVWCPTVHSD